MDGQAQPGLHGVHMDKAAVVAGLDGGGKRRDVLLCAGLVVDSHTAGQHGVFVHSGAQAVQIEMPVGFRRDLHHLKAPVPQRPHGQLHTGMLEPRNHNFAAPAPAGNGRALNGDVVALAAAGGKIQLFGRTAEAFGHLGAGGGEGFVNLYRRLIQAGRVGPAAAQRCGNGIGHRRVHHGGGGIVKIMELRVGSHARGLFSCQYTK